MLKRKTIQLSLSVVIAVTMCTSCEKLIPVGPGGGSGDPGIPPVGASGTQLTTITGADGGHTKISYDAHKNPLVISTYMDGGELLTKDSCVYDAEGKLRELRGYGQDFMTGKSTLISTDTFEWDGKGNISRAVSRSSSNGAQLSSTDYTYDDRNRLIRIAQLFKIAGQPESSVVALSYGNDKNVKQVILTIAGKVQSKTVVSGYDGHGSFYTHKLLPYLLDFVQEEEFSEQNAVEKRQVSYINLGSKTDSIITLTKNSYQYNTLKLPVKQVSSISIGQNGNPQNTTVSTSFSYGK